MKPMIFVLCLLFGLCQAALAAPEENLTGTWQCKAKTPDGSEVLFTLELKQEGEEVKGTASSSDQGPFEITKGTFKEGKLELTVKGREHTYTLTGSLKEGKLTGQWRQEDTGESGSWEGARKEEKKTQI